MIDFYFVTRRPKRQKGVFRVSQDVSARSDFSNKEIQETFKLNLTKSPSYVQSQTVSTTVNDNEEELGELGKYIGRTRDIRKFTLGTDLSSSDP